MATTQSNSSKRPGLIARRAPAVRQRRTPAGAAAGARPAATLAAPRVALPAGHQGPVTVLGMDPGKHTGLAWFVDGQLYALEEIAPSQIMAMLQDRRPSLVIFEDSRKGGSWTARGSQAQRAKMNRNVGEIDGWCVLIETLCASLGIACFGIAPSAKAGRAHGAKIDAATFKRLTGWPGRSNQHQRDAAMIAWSFRRARA